MAKIQLPNFGQRGDDTKALSRTAGLFQGLVGGFQGEQSRQDKLKRENEQSVMDNEMALAKLKGVTPVGPTVQSLWPEAPASIAMDTLDDKYKRAQFALSAAQKRKPGETTQRQIAEAKTVPAMIEDVTETLENSLDLFGPVEGRLREWNPWDERAQVVDAEIRATTQMFGRLMEGGVLRKEDEVKYRKMFPKLSDTPEVAKGKLAVVKRMAAKRLSEILKVHGAYTDVARTGAPPSIPPLPDILTRPPPRRVSPGDRNNIPAWSETLPPAVKSLVDQALEAGLSWEEISQSDDVKGYLQ